ncbi:hypothetical protein ACGF0J_24570 [Nonomuraea sp. NPDC047897]|uniref:hypothetical protein n=1 Tax=Nonomuraea sp. NPDC047897 TaxID=3364346 RepID=UPI00371A44B2
MPPPRPAADTAARAGAARLRAARPAAQRRPERRRQRAPFVLLVVGLLCGGLMSLLLLNTVLARDSITAGELREDIANARRHNEYLRQENDRATQPDAIADQAEQQGLTRDTGINPLPLDDEAPLPGRAAEPGPQRGASPDGRSGTGTGTETGAEAPEAGTESGSVGRAR